MTAAPAPPAAPGTAPGAAPARSPGPHLRRWLAAGVTLLCLLLPALAAGANIDAPPLQAELRRVGWALGASGAETGGDVLRLFYGATVGPEAEAAWPAQAAAVVSQARFAAVLAVLATTLLLYLAVAASRGRGNALIACVALAVLPPIGREGWLLRPEAPAGLFGLFGVVLCLSWPLLVQRRAGKTPLRRAVRLGIVALYAGTAFGLAVACTPRAGSYLLVPMGAAVLATALLLVRVPRWARRVRRGGLPFAALTARLAPWVLLAVAALGTTAVVQHVAGAGEPADVVPYVAATLLPQRPLWRLLLLVLLGLGALRLVLGVGFRLGRRRRIGSDSVLLLYVGALLMPHALGPEGMDALLAAPAAAVVVAEGAVLFVFLVLGFLAQRVARGR